MTSGSCDRAALVEAMFDGRLGPSERASSERHLASCASCTALARALGSMQELLRSSSTPISALEHQRARLALLRVSAKPATSRRKPAALIVVALSMLPLAAWAAVSKLAPSMGAAVSIEKNGQHDEPAKPKHPRAASKQTTATTEPPAPVTSAAPVESPAPLAVAPAHVSLQPSAAHRKRAPARVDPVTSAPPAHEPPQGSHDFAEAMKLLERGDFSASASKLASFAASYPNDPRVEDAAYLEAIALERAGRMVEAKAAARRYVSTYPAGAHRVQARRLAGD